MLYLHDMKLLRFLILITLIFVSSSIFAKSSLEEQIFDEGMELFMRKDYRGSSSYLGQVVDMQPNHHQARYYFVLSLVFQGRTNEALKHLTILRKNFPHSAVYSSLETDLRRNMMPQKTVSEREIYSGNIITENRKIRQTVKNKNTEKLASDFVKVVNLIDEENYEQAEILLKQFIKNKKNDADKGRAHALLGLIYFNRQNYPLAVEHYKKSFGLKAGDFEANFMTASAYINMQMPDEALKYFKAALKINDDDIFARTYMADIYVKQAKYAEAEQVYKDILKIDATVTDAEVGLANLQLEQGFVENAVNLVNDILSKNPDNAKARFLKARALLEKQLYAESMEEAEYAYAKNPANIEYRIFTALVNVRNFQVQTAIEDLNQILQQYPSNVYALNVMAEAEITAGNTKEGKKYLELAETYEKTPTTSLLKGLLAVSEQKIELAEQHYKEYLARSQNSPAALLEFARFSELTNKHEEILENYQKLIDSFPNTPYAVKAKEELANYKGNYADYGSNKPGGSHIY